MYFYFFLSVRVFVPPYRSNLFQNFSINEIIKINGINGSDTNFWRELAKRSCTKKVNGHETRY